MNKRKIINDPVHGFIKIRTDLIFDIISHPYFQRLRRIKQLGLSNYVYPGALHTRFHHALGTMHLMGLALDELRNKGFDISNEEFNAAQIAILLHDIGHGPMSHVLENTIIEVSHEKISELLMKRLNEEFDNQLSLAIKMFEGSYDRNFFHQLISSQLDMDRLDYIQRDCFFTGVQEGTIAAERIIKLLSIVNDEIVVEEKGIYSIENFLTARRIMYWQVYLHKTNLALEENLIQIFKRVRYLVLQKKEVFIPPALSPFLENIVTAKSLKQTDATILENNSDFLKNFAELDDYDIFYAIKIWTKNKDKILSRLSSMLINRRLFKIFLSTEKIDREIFENKKIEIAKKLNISKDDTKYFVRKGDVKNEAYWKKGETIKILSKKGKILDIAQASDLSNIKALRKIVKKYYFCWVDVD